MKRSWLMTDAFERQARALCLSTPICDLGSRDAIKIVAIGLRETWRMARESRDAEVSALMEKADNFERAAVANHRRATHQADLLNIAKRWAALDGGSWHVERHAREKAELLADTKALISKVEQTDD